MTQVKVSTKMDKQSAAQSTVLGIDWTGITREQLEAGYQSYMIVKLQGTWRRNELIPSRANVMAKDFAPGSRTTTGVSEADMQALVAGLKPYQLKAWVGGMPIAEASQMPAPDGYVQEEDDEQEAA